MKNYFYSFLEIIKSWVFIIFFIADFLGYIVNLFGSLTFPPVVYIYVLLIGIVLSSTRIVAIKNTAIKKIESNNKVKLFLTVENPEADNKPVVLENPDRPHTQNTLSLFVHNSDERKDAEQLEVRLKWPLEGFTIHNIWDETGNNSDVWKSVDNEKVYFLNKTVYAGKKRKVGLMLIKKFDGETGKVKYEINAKNAVPTVDEVILKKVKDPNYLGL